MVSASVKREQGTRVACPASPLFDRLLCRTFLELAAPIGQVQQVMADIDSWSRWHPLLDAVEGELVVVGGTT